MRVLNPNPQPVIPSPALSFVGRKNSGKTTLLENLIAVLTKQGVAVASIKHHGHPDFDIDIPGRDSYRHRMAGARSVTILSDTRYAQVTELDRPLSCESVISTLSGFDIVLIEGFRKANVEHLELFRAANPRDMQVVDECISQWEVSLKARPAAVVSDIEKVITAAKLLHIPSFTFSDISSLATFVQKHFARPPLSVVIQAGGESKRMGTPKEALNFLGKPLIQQAVERLVPLADELIITTNAPERLHTLKQEYPDITFVADLLPERGALPGIYTALSSAHHDLVAVVACDMIDIPVPLIAQEALYMRPIHQKSYDVVFPKTENGIEPFAAVYRKKPCLATLEPFMAKNTRQARVREFIAQLNYAMIDCTHPIKCVRYGGSFLNINTPEDLARAEKIFSQDPSCLP